MSDIAVDAKDTESADDAAPEVPAPDPIFADTAPKPDRQPSGDPIPIATPSRRTRTRDELSRIEASVREANETNRAALAARDAQIAQLTGGMQTLQQILQAQAAAPQYRAPAPVEDDADSLEAKALAKLDEKDVAGFMKLHTQAVLKRIPQPQQQYVQAPQAPQMHPALMALNVSFPAVAMAPNGMEVVEHEDNELRLSGVAPGPNRVRQAFENASKKLLARSGGGQSQAPRYSQDSASVLAGVPTARGSASAGTGEPGVRLSAYEKSVAKQCGMTESEYAKHMGVVNPSRIER